MEGRYNSYSSSLVEKYGYRIFRVGVDAGFSCPNRRGPNKEGGCVYCDSMGATAAYLRKSESGFSHDSTFEENIDNIVEKNRRQAMKDQIDRGIEFLKRRYKAEHFALYFQSFSNTFAPVAKLKEIYDFALGDYSWDGLIVSTRPDCLDGEKLSLLASYKERVGNVCLELGLQSGCDDILKAMNRGHDVKCFVNACEGAKRYGLELCVHVLTGFPGEGQAQLDQTIDVIKSVHPDAIKIHNLNIAAGTALYEKYLDGEVTAPCSKRHIANTIYILRRIPSDIVIERLICETPSHRLACPRSFPDKNSYLRALEAEMERRDVRQGDLWAKH